MTITTTEVERKVAMALACAQEHDVCGAFERGDFRIVTRNEYADIVRNRYV